MKNLIVLIGVLCLSSCLKKEIPVPKRLNNGVRTVAINMENDYRYQVFFNLANNEIVEKNDKYIWDIAFETGTDGWHIKTNTSKYMFAYRTDKTDLLAVMDHAGATPNKHFYDKPSGNLDSTAIGNWKDGFVRILDMGTSNDGHTLGWYKIKVDSVDAQYYYLQYAVIDASTFTSISVKKDNSHAFVYYSLIDDQAVDVAPQPQKWDLEFTQFIRHLTDPTTVDYLVTGCLSNREGVTSALVTDKDFNSIDLAYALSLHLNEAENTIGYDWKDIGLDEVMNGGTAEYTIYPNMSYVIKDQNGNYYKLRFIDFYSKSGEKGTPTFEYKKLE